MLREGHPDRGAGADLTLQVDACIVQKGDVLDDRKAQTGAAGCLGAALVHAVEPLKHAGLAVLRDADAVVLDLKVGAAVTAYAAAQLYMAARAVVAYGVVAQVLGQLAQLVAAALHGGGPGVILQRHIGAAGVDRHVLGGLLAKLDMRSGLERLAYAVLIILVATMTAWIMALLLHLQPVQFPALSLTLPEEIVFRLLASFGGVFGFSLMFNSPRNLAVCAALIGAVTNTFRLELVSLAGFPPAIAAFLGALLSGLLASCLKSAVGYPRISVTVPSIVIMVPGLYFYRAIYNLGILSLMDSATWFADAILIIVALPLGLIFARIVTDKTFRYCT